MASPNLVNFVKGLLWVEDTGAGNGTPFNKASMDGTTDPLIVYVQNHIDGKKQDGTAGNNHALADIDSRNGGTPLSETLAYANLASTVYTAEQRISMILNVLSAFAGGAGTLTARLTTLAALSNNNLVALANAVNNSSATAAVGKFAIRTDTSDTVGGGGLLGTYFNSVPLSANVPNYWGRRFSAGSTQPFLVYLNETLGANLFFVSSDGSVTTAASFLGASAVISGNITARQRTLIGPNGVPLTSVAGMDYSATGTTMVLTVNAGAYLTSTKAVNNYAGGTITVASTGAQTYVGIYITDAGVLTATANSATPAVQFPNSGIKELYVLNVPAGATQIASMSSTPAAGQAFVLYDLRLLANGSTPASMGINTAAATGTLLQIGGTVANASGNATGIGMSLTAAPSLGARAFGVNLVGFTVDTAAGAVGNPNTLRIIGPVKTGAGSFAIGTALEVAVGSGGTANRIANFDGSATTGGSTVIWDKAGHEAIVAGTAPTTSSLLAGVTSAQVGSSAGAASGGRDRRFLLTIVTSGVIGTASTVCAVTWGSAFEAAPLKAILTPADSLTWALAGTAQLTATGESTTGFNVTSGSTSPAAGTYKYVVDVI